MYRNILACCKLGQKKLGVDLGSRELARNLNLTDNHILEMKSYNDYFKLYNFNKALLKKKIIPLNIGGDHSIAFSTVSASLKEYQQNLAVIWIDAHMDINTPKSSPSGNIHGMPLSQICGNSLIFKFDNKNVLNYNNLLYIGIRDIDPYEEELLFECNIKYINVNQINNFDKNIIDEINSFIKHKYIHLSVDVDAFDPTLISNTGTPVNNGIDIYQFIKLYKQTNIKNKLVNLDFVEFNPLINNNPYKLSKEYQLINQLFYNLII